MKGLRTFLLRQTGRIISRLTPVFHFISNRILIALSILGLGLSSTFLCGCTHLHYLLQAGRGQLALINHARPIPEVIKDERTPPRIRSLLEEIPAIKAYGEQNGLKPTTNYTEYVKLDRSAAVYVVNACEPLQFKTKEWSFPIAGTFPFLGWFDLKDAKDFAQTLKAEGWDVDVRGAGAYSTLGWFKDAILSTMISPGEEAFGDLVNVVLHESVHATLYIDGQAFFNESIASFVADHLTLLYLDQKKGVESIEKKAYVDAEKTSAESRKKLHQAYATLDELYRSSLPDAEKLQKKKEILEKLKTDLHFRRDITNATLVQYKTYNSGQPEFEDLIQACNGNTKRFMDLLKTKLNEKSFERPQQDSFRTVLQPYIENQCR